MRKDLLTELHLPKLDIKCLKEIVTQNSSRLAHIVKDNDEFIKKNNIVPLGYKGINVSMVPDFSDFTHSVNSTEGKADTVNGGNVSEVIEEISGNMGVDSNQDVNQLLQNSSPPTVTVGTGCETLASHLGWGSENEDEDAEEVVEIRPGPMRFNLKTDTPWDLDLTTGKSDEFECGVYNETEFFSNGYLNSICDEDTELPFLLENKLDSPDVNPVPIVGNVKPVKCYVRKKNTPKISQTQEEAIGNNKEQNKDSPMDEKSHPLFVISDIMGNADVAFSPPEAPVPVTDTPSTGDVSLENTSDLQDAQLITPKKTNDITKIKGWRRKQFFVEKPTTVEFYSFSNGSSTEKKIELEDLRKAEELEDPGNIENAFVCDTLDEFLDQEAELKINYEIPHLYAEVGIKLTSEEIVSRPNLSEEDFKSVETRYCVPIKLVDLESNIDLVEENIKGVKRCNEEEKEPCKLLKLDENRCRPIKVVQNSPQIPTIIQKELSPAQNTTHVCDSGNTTITSKLIGLVVYPGPHNPVHPIVRHHLQKLRSFRTKIDKNWANFAASAVLTKRKNLERQILPVVCCGKTEISPETVNMRVVEDVVQKIVDSVCAGNCESRKESDVEIIEAKKQSSQQVSPPSKQDFKLKKCSVVIEKLNLKNNSQAWCMVHERYDCFPCELYRKPESNVTKSDLTNWKDLELGKVVQILPKSTFDKEVAGLLAKKLRDLKLNTLTSIDCLKTIRPNSIEFIKLNFIKQSFFTGYINIWFLRPDAASVRSRAFLTFTKTPPLPKAINLKSTVVTTECLPKVITDILSRGKPFDPNEFAILHCNGIVWEIHGSLNIAVPRQNANPEPDPDPPLYPDKDVDQIFTPSSLPELRELRDISLMILNKQVAKWWVLDLKQDFQNIEIGTKFEVTSVSRESIFGTIKSSLFGFIPVWKDASGRVLGAYIAQKLVPFVLVGPYHLWETHHLVMRNERSQIPFIYCSEEGVPRYQRLRFFISSAVKELELNGKKLEGLWLYDKIHLDKTCYLEVITMKSDDYDDTLPKKLHNINVEHGYSLNSLPYLAVPCKSASGNIVRLRDSTPRKVTVYLYFDIFDLGYVEGMLHEDKTVVIDHPLHPGTNVKSHNIGHCFVKAISRRIKFYPMNLAIRWFVTKHLEDLGGRSPFNRFWLGGAHILCKSGIFCVLSLTSAKLRELGIDKSEIKGAKRENSLLTDIKLLQYLARILSPKETNSLSLEEVARMAMGEIKKLEKEEKDLKIIKKKWIKTNSELIVLFFTKLERLQLDEEMKTRIATNFVNDIEGFFQKENLDNYFSMVLEGIGMRGGCLDRLRSTIKTQYEEEPPIPESQSMLIELTEVNEKDPLAIDDPVGTCENANPANAPNELNYLKMAAKPWPVQDVLLSQLDLISNNVLPEPDLPLKQKRARRSEEESPIVQNNLPVTPNAKTPQSAESVRHPLPEPPQSTQRFTVLQNSTASTPSDGSQIARSVEKVYLKQDLNIVRNNVTSIPSHKTQPRARKSTHLTAQELLNNNFKPVTGELKPKKMKRKKKRIKYVTRETQTFCHVKNGGKSGEPPIQVIAAMDSKLKSILQSTEISTTSSESIERFPNTPKTTLYQAGSIDEEDNFKKKLRKRCKVLINRVAVVPGENLKVTYGTRPTKSGKKLVTVETQTPWPFLNCTNGVIDHNGTFTKSKMKKTRFLPSQKIIIKNVKNNKTAIHRLNYPNVGKPPPQNINLNLSNSLIKDSEINVAEIMEEIPSNR